jgi:hypothetical protein
MLNPVEGLDYEQFIATLNSSLPPPAMPNPGQPTISLGATGDGARRLQRALRRTPDLGITVSGVFDAQTETAVGLNYVIN